jgi:hypothetical protein
MVRIAFMRHAGVMPDLPMPLRAALGLVATAMDEARRLPDRAIELPMLAVGTVLQVSMRAQQRYAELVARGDEWIGSQQVSDEPPEWARFDDPADGHATGDAATGDAGTTDSAAAPDTAPAEDVAAEGTGEGGAAESGAERAAPKSVPAPRHTEPSRFDTVDDD